MTARTHHYRLTLEWTGDLGSGTSGYRTYSRDHVLSGPHKSVIEGSSDPAFFGDAARWNPEELLVASLSACHQLWYLHLASEAGLIVIAYRDDPEGVMVEDADGGGRFQSVTLRPQIILSGQHDDAALEVANSLHVEAHRFCFIARSMAFPVDCQPTALIRSR